MTIARPRWRRLISSSVIPYVTDQLALRRLVLTSTQIGRLPKQTDFSDYRDAGGIKLPYEVKFSSVDPWIGSTRKYTEIKLAN